MSLNRFDLQFLEGRRMFSMTSVLDAAGTLTITGTAGNDSLYVSYRLADKKVLVNDLSAAPAWTRPTTPVGA